MADTDTRNNVLNVDNVPNRSQKSDKNESKVGNKKLNTPRKDKPKSDGRVNRPKKGSKNADSVPERTVGKLKMEITKKDTGDAKTISKDGGKVTSDFDTKEDNKDGDEKPEKTPRIEFPCDACAREGITVDSTNFCSECSENICGDCVKQHRKFPAMKSHAILGKSSRRRSSTVKTEDDGEPSSEQKLLECNNHTGKAVEMFCRYHDNVWCAVCMAMHHRSCEGVSSIKESCKNITRTKECKDLKVSVRKLKKEVDVMQAKVQKNTESLVKRRDEVLTTIKTFRKRIESKLDEIEQATIQQLDDVFEKNSKEIEDDVEACKQASADLEEIEMVMDMKPTDTNVDFNMFVYMKRANPRMAVAKEVMQKVSGKVGDERIKFFVDTKLEEMLDEGNQAFGHFVYKYTTESVSIAIEKDKEKVNVTEIANLPDGRFLLSDSGNKRLKLFEKDFKYIDHMDLPKPSHGVSALDRSSAVVSLPEDKLVQFVTLDPHISLINSIDVGVPCRGLSSFENEIYVICGGHEGECQGHIRIYNMTGEVTRTIERDVLGKKLFTTLVSVVVSKATGIIYVTDKTKGIVSIKQSGELLPEVSDKALLCPWGICEDDKQQLFVTGHDSDDVWQIRGSTPLGVLLNAKNGVTKPLCISYIESSSKIIFATKNCNDITVCTPLTKLAQEEQVGVKGQDKHQWKHTKIKYE